MDQHAVCSESDLAERHKTEKKELEGKIVSLRKSCNKNDKKRKKEVQEEICRLQLELERKHAAELSQSNSSGSSIYTTPPDKEPDAVIASEMAEITLNGDARMAEAESQNEVAEEVSETGPSLSSSAPRQKISKAQRRRDKKEMESKAREERIAAEEKLNENGVRQMEARRIAELLSKRDLRLHEIPSDGDCLYGALSHQLSQQGQILPVSTMRKLIGQHMLENVDDFLPFLADPESGCDMDPVAFRAYCKSVENTSAWGSQLEIKALSDILKISVEVIQAEGPTIVIGERYQKGGANGNNGNGTTTFVNSNSLVITYHRHAFGLGEHYNSVVLLTK